MVSITECDEVVPGDPELLHTLTDLKLSRLVECRNISLGLVSIRPLYLQPSVQFVEPALVIMRRLVVRADDEL